MSKADSESDLPDEFSLIEQLFAPLAGPGAFGLTDDAAVLQASPGHDLVLTKDAIAEGRHYLADDPPGDVARKLLRVNLSDLAAKGARPRGYLLACAWSDATSFAWMQAFARGLGDDQVRYGVSLLGGDTIKVDGPSVFTLTAIGEVAQGKMVRRMGAHAGDDLYVTGTIGDAALGLKGALGELNDLADATKAQLIERYRLPDPPVSFGARLVEVATAALDVSDGLLGDLAHLCEVSSVSAVVEQAQLPLSDICTEAVKARRELWTSVLAGGDDYQILFTAPADAASDITAIAADTGTRVTRIGRVESGSGIEVRDLDGNLSVPDTKGFSHF